MAKLCTTKLRLNFLLLLCVQIFLQSGSAWSGTSMGKLINDKNSKTTIINNTIELKSSHHALKRVRKSIEKQFTKRNCRADETLAVFDLDDTMLERSEGVIHSIRSAPKILDDLRKLKVATLGLTSRRVFPPKLIAVLRA